jgi:PAS domain S-box-containing protein
MRNKSNKNEYDLFVSIMSEAPGHFYWKDKKGICRGANNAQAIFLGYKSGKDLIGKTDFDFFYKEQAEFIHKIDKQVMKTKKEYCIEEIVSRGEVKTIFLSRKIPLFDPNTKQVIGIIGISLDITASKQAEIAKQEFLMNMAHDLRTPLAGIISLSNIQAKEETNAQDKNLWMWVHDSGEQLLELLNSVIELTAAEHIVDRIKQEKIDLIKLAEELYNLMLPTVESKNLTLQLKIDPQLPIIISDRIKLKRILLNILSNALKFTEQGKISLEINLLSIVNKQAKIKIIITDTGIGIPKDKQDKIFDRFYRVHSSYRTEYSGYGIGLYLVKETTKALGGKIKVSSEEEKGSRFTLEFNFALAETDSKLIVPNSSELIVESEVLTDQHKGTVLVAEDNTLVLYAMNKMLLSLAYRAITVSSGEAALHALQTKTCDWALLDIGLPDLDGMEVTRHFREWEKLNNKPHLPIFALTAHAEKKIKNQCKKVGFDYVLEKPFTEKDLKRIEKFLK